MSTFALIFDMDGVIIDSNPYHKVALKEFCARYGYALDEEQLRQKIYGRTNKEWIRNVMGEISEEDFHRYEEEKESLFRDLYLPHIKALQGLEDFLKNAQAQSIPMAIGTSAPPSNLDFVMKHTGFSDYFSHKLDETHVKKGKPEPEIYLKVAAALEFAPQNCLVFEDSVSGVQAARSAGCKVVGVGTTHTEAELAPLDQFILDFEGLAPESLARHFA